MGDVGEQADGVGGDVMGGDFQGVAGAFGEALGGQGKIEAGDAFVDGGGCG